MSLGSWHVAAEQVVSGDVPKAARPSILRWIFMNSKLLAIAFLLAAETSAASTLIECPQTLDVSTSLNTPTGWEAIPPRSKPSLDGITVYYRHPKELQSQVPTELPDKDGFELVQWEVGPDSSETWLECRYRGTHNTIAKRLPKGLSTCIAYYKKVNYGLGPLERFECK